MPAFPIVALVLLKWVAYSAWCWLGLRLSSAGRPTVARAFVLGLLRVAVGFALGWGFVFALAFLAPGHNRLGVSIPALLGGSVVLRWVEWCLLGALAFRSGWSLRGVLGRGGRQHLWRAGGVVLSFATDVAAISGIGVLGLVPC